MEKKQIAEILDEMGTLLELKGENPFRVRAYRNASLVISTLNADLAQLAAQGTLTSIKGIGKGLAEIITELMRTGTSKEHEQLRASVPAGLREMLRIQGLGPKRIKLLYEKLGLTSIDALRKACEEHRLMALEGFAAKTEENILKSIQHLSSMSSKHLYSTAREAADALVTEISRVKGVQRCEVAGSLRRRKELIGDIDIIASVPAVHRKRVFDAFTSHGHVLTILARGDTKSSVILKNGIQCDLRVVEEREYPFALNYFTGCKEHNVEMRLRALKRGLSLNEYAFTRTENPAMRGKTVPVCKDEDDIYRALGLAFVPPELRENQGEFDAAEKDEFPHLIDNADIRGTFHCHTNASDGVNTLEEMAEAARALGWEYLGIADHSKAAAYAGGLSPAKVKAQIRAIDRWNDANEEFRLFKGTECDILTDGSLDYSDNLLASFDYVVVSIHSKFKMTQSEATKRITTALKNRHVTMLGHPTGRLLLEREGYPVDMTEVINVAAGERKAIEINAHPMRLDLDWRFVRYAKEKGVPIFINPDAHTTEGLKDVFYGVGIARKGWLEAKDVVNAWKTASVEKFLKALQKG